MPHPEPFSTPPRLRTSARWVALVTLIALLAGLSSALFLVTLDWVTRSHQAHRWLVWGLPLAGFAVGWVYLKWGQSVAGGNNHLLGEIQQPAHTVPLRMAPLILGGTLISHLFGASVGREGTAVQMGGALADQLSPVFKLTPVERRMVLMAGMAAGFAAVFGTPLAGAVFALEVLVLLKLELGRLRLQAWLPCLAAAVLADQVVRFLGVSHASYVLGAVPPLTWGLLGAVALAGLAFGLAGRWFAQSTHALSAFMARHIAYAPLRPLLGGLVLALAFTWGDFERYSGLGLAVMQEAFVQPLSLVDALGKWVSTVVSLGVGFKGGEVTPLFYIGTTLGNALASAMNQVLLPWLNVPFALLAAVGFVAVFGGVAHTPVAATVMALELFGASLSLAVYAALACVVSHVCAGRVGIYRAQQAAPLSNQALKTQAVEPPC